MIPSGMVGRGLLALAVSAVLATGLRYGLAWEGAAQVAPVRDPGPAPDPYRLPGSIPDGWCHVLYVLGGDVQPPSGLAPVATVDDRGGVRLLRAPPLPSGPEVEPWLAAGVQLPGSRLDALGPDSRAAVLALFRSWQGRLGRTARWRAVAVGVEDPEELEILARWER